MIAESNFIPVIVSAVSDANLFGYLDNVINEVVGYAKVLCNL